MKKVKNFGKLLLLFSVLLSNFMPIHAEEETVRGMISTSDGRGVNLRTGPGTSYSRAGGLDDGRIVTIIDEVETDDSSTGCTTGKWYKLIYSNHESGYAYTCTNFVKIIEEVPINYNFEEELEKFPESYHPYLKALHEIYPNASFIAVNATNTKENSKELGEWMSFDTALYNETISLGKSLIEDTKQTRNGLKNLASYSYDTNTFANNYPGGGKSWYAASQEVVAYYLDPRNFLNEQRVFMFESLSYHASYQTVTGVENILSGSYMANTYVDNGTDKKFSDTIMDAGIYSGVSPYFLASRILQEVGYTRSALVKGTYSSYPEFNGYYNYYNIGAGGNDVVYNGLMKAKEQGWNSEYKAIVYGSSWIGNNYINVGQDSRYFQKWDIQCQNKSSCFSHQYMQNIEAPYSESLKTYNAYKKALGENMYTLSYVFSIPVYRDMPEKTSYPSEASPIAYLNALTVNGISVPNFYGLTSEYSVTLPFGTTSIQINASPTSNEAKVTGVGSIDITAQKQDTSITVTAGNGNTKTYVIHLNILEQDSSEMTLEQTLENIKGPIFQDTFVQGITNVEAIKKAVLEANPAALVTVTDLNGTTLTSGNLGTGYKVKIQVNQEANEYEVVIYGDTNGDGEISILDLLRIQKQLLNHIQFTSCQSKASDINKDGSVTILDLLLVQKHLLGSKQIQQ